MERIAIQQAIAATEAWVYEAHGQVAAFIALIGEREVGGFFVDPALQRQGIGRALMDHARELRGRLELDVFEENEQGRRFYDRYGFRRVGDHVHEATGRVELRLELPELRVRECASRGQAEDVSPVACEQFRGGPGRAQCAASRGQYRRVMCHLPSAIGEAGSGGVLSVAGGGARPGSSAIRPTASSALPSHRKSGVGQVGAVGASADGSFEVLP